jgi:hypothetical protein
MITSQAQIRLAQNPSCISAPDGEFDMTKACEKVDPETGTLTEFKGEKGAKVGYDGPHKSPGAHHESQHISWQSSGKRGMVEKEVIFHMMAQDILQDHQGNNYGQITDQ